jgi:LDH2 family malate/lactate/ureidoglycolate dehydrogenase
LPRIDHRHLRRLAQTILIAVGAPSDKAQAVADSLVDSNLAGHDSHGVLRIPQYVQLVRDGFIDPQAEPGVLRQTPATAVVDGRWGFGQITARYGMDLAIAKAREQGAAAVALAHCGHVGRLGEWTLMAAHQKMVGIALCNGSVRAPGLAPFGGIEPVFGTDPIAIAMPCADGDPILSDFATAGMAEGKLRVALSKGETIPPGYLVDHQGRPTTDPRDFYEGGALLPFGGYKGYTLAFAAEALGGLLTGFGLTGFPGFHPGNGVLLIVLDLAAFCSVEEFKESVKRLCRRVKGSQRAPGVQEILVPGEPEARSAAERRRQGIDVPEATWEQLLALTQELGCPTSTEW